MKIISTELHGVLDYTVAFCIIALPWIFNFPAGPPTLVLVTSGIVTILYSLFTRYELSIVKVVSFSFHLFLDGFSGVLIAASPWIFAFHDSLYLPYLVIGIMELTVVLLSKNTSRQLNKNRSAKNRKFS